MEEFKSHIHYCKQIVDSDFVPLLNPSLKDALAFSNFLEGIS